MRCSLAEKGKTMAKKTKRKSHGIMRSDIPYKDRLIENGRIYCAEDDNGNIVSTKTLGSDCNDKS